MFQSFTARTHIGLLTLSLVALLFGLGSLRLASAQSSFGTAFTYQGLLQHTAGSVNNSCDFQFRLFTDATVSLTINPVNDPPVLSALAVDPALVALRAAVNTSVGFSDPDSIDTHTA
jgi:hypothetical protein